MGPSPGPTARRLLSEAKEVTVPIEPLDTGPPHHLEEERVARDADGVLHGDVAVRAAVAAEEPPAEGVAATAVEHDRGALVGRKLVEMGRDLVVADGGVRSRQVAGEGHADHRVRHRRVLARALVDVEGKRQHAERCRLEVVQKLDGSAAEREAEQRAAAHPTVVAEREKVEAAVEEAMIEEEPEIAHLQ